MRTPTSCGSRYSCRLTIIFTLFTLLGGLQSVNGQNRSIILGRPTDTSITASVMFDKNVKYYLEYGLVSGDYTHASDSIIGTANVPNEIDLHNLVPDAQYYYRVQYEPSGSSAYTASPEYSFHTQRAPGSTFTFTIEADEHLYDKKGVLNMYNVTLANEAKDKPDFMLTLGDIFGDDHQPFTITSGQLDSLHKYYRPLLGSICHSIPFYVCLGNHEGEKNYYLDQTPPNNMAIWGTQWRKYYYPNPYPNGFYSGDTTIEPYGIGNAENYYAWTWGDALLVVLDVYRYDCDTSAKPHNWDWTLGLTEYNWLKNTLESSKAKYKFVFAHHIRAEDRGGITNAKLFEWGGYEANGSSNTFALHRPGWPKPIHQLFVDNGVNIFFQGHDHLFAHEMLNGITYQEVPMAADSTYKIGMLANAAAYTADTLDGTGHIRVTVSPEAVKVDYVRAYLPADTVSGAHHNGEVAFSYTLPSLAAVVPDQIRKDQPISVVPNPSQDKIIVFMPDNLSHYEIELLDVFGRKVKSAGTNQIDIRNFPNGVYLVNVTAEGYYSSAKFVVEH